MLLKEFKEIIVEVCQINISLIGGWCNLKGSRCHKNSSCAIFVPKVFCFSRLFSG